MSHPSPCMALQEAFLRSKLQRFGIVSPHCASDTRTCISVTEAGMDFRNSINKLRPISAAEEPGSLVYM